MSTFFSLYVHVCLRWWFNYDNNNNNKPTYIFEHRKSLYELETNVIVLFEVVFAVSMWQYGKKERSFKTVVSTTSKTTSTFSFSFSCSFWAVNKKQKKFKTWHVRRRNIPPVACWCHWSCLLWPKRKKKKNKNQNKNMIVHPRGSGALDESCCGFVRASVGLRSRDRSRPERNVAKFVVMKIYSVSWKVCKDANLCFSAAVKTKKIFSNSAQNNSNDNNEGVTKFDDWDKTRTRTRTKSKQTNTKK